MTISWTLAFDAADPHRAAAFWADALGYVAEPGYDDPDGASIVDPDGTRPAISFLRVPEPKMAKNRVHIDIHVAVGMQGDERRRAIEAEAARLTGLGAPVLVRVEPGMLSEFFIVMADPEGNEFCVV